jgi:5-methylcytosine-specific restriction endonuclease McrA
MKQCKTCGETKPLQQFVKDKRRSDGRGSWCKPCANAYGRKYYDRDLEQSRAQKRAYIDANRGRSRAQKREYDQQWRRDNPELAREKAARDSKRFRETNPDYFREWYEHHIEQQRERSRLVMERLRRERPELEREWKRRYRTKNAALVKEREREKTYARRALQPHSATLARLMTEIVQRPCVYCGATENITIDHIVPLSRGGKHEADNLTPACFPCNSSKCDRLLTEWAGRRTG